MTNLTWDGEPDSSVSDSSDSGLTLLGLDALGSSDALAPVTVPVPVFVPAPDPTLRAADVAAPTPLAAGTLPMTRRELRERERAAALQVEASAAPQMVKSPVRELPTVSSASKTVVAPRQVAAADPRVNTRSRGAKAERMSRSRRATGQRNLGRTHEPAIVQAASISAAARVGSRASQKRPFKRRLLAKLMSVGAMVGAALMIVSTSVPANAFFRADSSSPAVVSASQLPKSAPVAAPVQSVLASPLVESAAVSRDAYTATSLREQIFLRYGNRNFTYTPDPTGTIRWPFPVAVPISDGWGPRVAPCNGCSTFHHGVDFTPGAGTAIGAIADGVVIGINDLDWSFGQHVLVDHVINGVHIQSLYAHMQTGTVRVKMGQVIKVGDEIGQVGSTGESTGAHLHLEIHINGVPVDPFAWLVANAH